jgi:hypothetical protein
MAFRDASATLDRRCGKRTDAKTKGRRASGRRAAAARRAADSRRVRGLRYGEGSWLPRARRGNFSRDNPTCRRSNQQTLPLWARKRKRSTRAIARKQNFLAWRSSAARNCQESQHLLIFSRIIAFPCVLAHFALHSHNCWCCVTMPDSWRGSFSCSLPRMGGISTPSRSGPIPRARRQPFPRARPVFRPCTLKEQRKLQCINTGEIGKDPRADPLCRHPRDSFLHSAMQIRGIRGALGVAAQVGRRQKGKHRRKNT